LVNLTCDRVCCIFLCLEADDFFVRHGVSHECLHKRVAVRLCQFLNREHTVATSYLNRDILWEAGLRVVTAKVSERVRELLYLSV
jgi:hypothetical protein